MKSKHSAYPKIPQFRNIIRDICMQATFVGLDENGDPIYDGSLPKPVLEFTGTIKLHGTNGAVCQDGEGNIYFQSRKNIVTPLKDNAGFAFWADSVKEEWNKRFFFIREAYNIPDYWVISIYGEWAGGNIQKNVGLQGLPKSFYMFSVKVTDPTKASEDNSTGESYWLSDEDVAKIPGNESKRLFNIFDFPTFKVTVDFAQPEYAQNKFVELTQQVEDECPVCKQQGIDGGLGEGLVWTVSYNNQVYRFKTKGEKHSVSNVKTIAAVDTEVLESINKFVTYAVTQNRFDQGIKEIFGAEQPFMGKEFGEFIRWMISDITLEEGDVMADNGLEPKQVNKSISLKVKDMFFRKFK